MDVLHRTLAPAFSGSDGCLPKADSPDKSMLAQLCALALQTGNGLPLQYFQMLQLYGIQANGLGMVGRNPVSNKGFPGVQIADKIDCNMPETETVENQTALALAGLQNSLGLSRNLALSFGLNQYPLPQNNRPMVGERKRKRGTQSLSAVTSLSTSNLSVELNERVEKLVALLEKVERPRTWTQEETFCVVLVVVQNESLVKQARYKELHLEFQNYMKELFNQETKKTRQAFWARHCRIREKLGSHEYEQLFWKGKEVPSVESHSQKRSKNM